MLSLFRRIFRDPKTQIDDRLRAEVGGDITAKYVVSAKELPAFRFVDIYRAIDEVLGDKNNLRRIESDNYEDLNSLLHGESLNWASRQIKKSSRTAWPVGTDQEVFLPIDQYWIFRSTQNPQADQVIVRLRYRQSDEKTVLEVAGRDSGDVDICISVFVEESLKTSIYRSQLLTMTYETGTKDEYGDIEKPERFRISFKVASPVSEEDFVVDEVVFKVLWRNVIDLHERRDSLKANGVPVRRGVLMYGPPGTGKTFACRYICGKLLNTTRIIVAGTALNRVAQIFDFARTYQPSIVILEDVDLVFSARDINLYSSALGDLLDQMDGLRPFEDVGVILTTNSIERMEAAIKDRPGRISQCIYFGPPGKILRKRYIAQYAKDYDYESVDVEELIRISNETTPAFIKEWIHRTVQIATERLDGNDSKLTLITEDFLEAYAEMKRFTEGSTGRIIGFLGSDN